MIVGVGQYVFVGRFAGQVYGRRRPVFFQKGTIRRATDKITPERNVNVKYTHTGDVARSCASEVFTFNAVVLELKASNRPFSRVFADTEASINMRLFVQLCWNLASSFAIVRLAASTLRGVKTIRVSRGVRCQLILLSSIDSLKTRGISDASPN